MSTNKTKSMAYGINVVWGTNGSDEDWDINDRRYDLLNAIKEIGATNTRVGITWCVVEAEQGIYDWEKTDKLVNLLHENGLELAACVANTPIWASGLDEDTLALVREKYPDFMTVLPCADENLPRLANWCYEAAKRYRGKIKYYEIGNEDDGCPAPIIIRDCTGRAVDVRMDGDPAIYTKRLKTCCEAIKTADPHAKVAVSGLAAGNSTGFLEQIYACGGRDYFDAVAIHPYDKLENGINWRWLEQTRDLLTHMGDAHKKLWLTEWGYAVNDADEQDLQKQAEAVEQVLLRMEKTDYIEQASLHILNDWRSHESNPDSVQKMGLIDIDLRPRPAFYAFKKAAYGQGETRNSLRVPSPPGTHQPGAGAPLPCQFVALSPSFSGCIADWSTIAPVVMSNAEGQGYGQVYLGWDESTMYIAVQVNDDTPYQPYGGEWLWRGDSLQIAFDPDRETRRWPGYGYDDTEYGFCITPSGVQGMRFNGGINHRNGVVVPFGLEQAVTKSPVRMSVTHTDTQYLYEIAIPWTEITPEGVSVGKTIGISLAYNDYVTPEHRSTYEFGSGITAGKDPSLFKPIVLIR